MDLKAKAKVKAEAILTKVKRATTAHLTKKIEEIAARTIRKAPPDKKDVPRYQAEGKKKMAAAQSLAVSHAKEAAKGFKPKIKK